MIKKGWGGKNMRGVDRRREKEKEKLRFFAWFAVYNRGSKHNVI